MLRNATRGMGKSNVMKHRADQIAAAYVQRWENAWNTDGPSAATKLYTADSVLIGYVFAIGQAEIEKLLTAIFEQGRTKISIKVINARELGDNVVLIASEYTASGVGSNGGKTLEGKSSYVLTQIGDAWLSAMHTAT